MTAAPLTECTCDSRGRSANDSKARRSPSERHQPATVRRTARQHLETLTFANVSSQSAPVHDSETPSDLLFDQHRGEVAAVQPDPMSQVCRRNDRTAVNHAHGNSSRADSQPSSRRHATMSSISVSPVRAGSRLWRSTRPSMRLHDDVEEHFHRAFGRSISLNRLSRRRSGMPSR